MDGERPHRASRVFHPQQHWQTLDFVLAAIAICFLAFALVGLVTMVVALHDVSSMQRDCSVHDCIQHGTVAATSGYYPVTFGRYCSITVDLDGASHQVLIAGSVCAQMPVGSGVDATTWRGKIVIVKTAAGTFGTAENPGVGVGAGVFRMLALVPFVLFVAMIHVDIANHRVVRRVLRSARPSS